jgi:hypothetical protein
MKSTGPDADNELDDSQVVNCGSDVTKIGCNNQRDVPWVLLLRTTTNSKSEPF